MSPGASREREQTRLENEQQKETLRRLIEVDFKEHLKGEKSSGEFQMPGLGT